MTLAPVAKSPAESPLLFERLAWHEFKAVEQLLDRPRYRLLFLNGVLEIQQTPGEPHETVKKRTAASEEVKGIDLSLLSQCILMTNHVDAIKTFQQSMQ